VSAARAEGEMARSRLAFGDVRVRDVITPDPPRARGWLTVEEYLREDAPNERDPIVVVERFDGTIAGVVSVDRLRSAPPSEGGMRRVQDFAVPLSSVRVAHPDDRLADIAVRPVRGRAGPVLVYDGDRFVGFVSPEAIASRRAVSPAAP
jgi:CBS domain containing-hemolysin-like protein